MMEEVSLVASDPLRVHDASSQQQPSSVDPAIVWPPRAPPHDRGHVHEVTRRRGQGQAGVPICGSWHTGPGGGDHASCAAARPGRQLTIDASLKLRLARATR